MHRTIERPKGVGVARTDEMVAHLQSKLVESGRTWAKLSTLVELAHRENVNDELIAEIEVALEVAGIHHSPSDLHTCSRSDTVLMSTKPFHDGGLPFSKEKELEDFIERHYRLLPPFSRCVAVDDQFEVVVEGDKVRIDLLFTERDGTLIVCELEHGDGAFETGSQICCYIEAVRASVAEKKRPPKIRGVVITGEPNPEQEKEVAGWCRKEGVTVDWYYYRLGLALTSAPPQLLDEDRATA